MKITIPQVLILKKNLDRAVESAEVFRKLDLDVANRITKAVLKQDMRTDITL